jgi:hypothetical protein
MSHEQIFERIHSHWLLRLIARVAIVVIVLFFVQCAAICINRGEWGWIVLYAANSGICWWIIRHLWSGRREQEKKKAAHG